jgi:hypothetical protein
MRPHIGHTPEPLVGFPSEQDPRLARALSLAARSQGTDWSELHTIVRDTVMVARQHRRTPESVIIFFKRQLERGAKSEMERGDYAALLDRVVRCCIDQYFRAD